VPGTGRPTDVIELVAVAMKDNDMVTVPRVAGKWMLHFHLRSATAARCPRAEARRAGTPLAPQCRVVF
jgi:hypothetical protein